MQLAALERVLGSKLDVQAEFVQFRDRTGSEDMDGFLAYLRERGLISGDVLRDLHAGDHIAVSRFIGLRDDGSVILAPAGPPREEGDDETASLPPLATSVEIGGTQTMVLGGPRSEETGGLGPAGPVLGESHRAGPPTSSANYTMLGRVGQGAMGEVYVARDRDLMRKVAFKTLSPRLADDSATAARFFNEVQVTAQLDHPNVVPIYEFEVADGGRLGYAMKLVHGRTLSQVIADARRAAGDGDPRAESRRLAERLEIFLKVCDAVAYAHNKGVLHRDLKPSNIMVGRYSEVYVMDWGICRVMGLPADEDEAAIDAGAASQMRDEPVAAESSEPPSPSDLARDADETVTLTGRDVPSLADVQALADAQALADVQALDASAPDARILRSSAQGQTQHGAVLGTPAYMSPEQARGLGGTLDPRSDLYGLGLILFELVSLRKAITGDSTYTVLFRAAGGEKDPLTHADPRLRIAPELDAIIAKATATAPEARYPNVDAFADDIRCHLRGEAVAARPDTALQAAMRWIGRNKMVTLVAMALLLLLGAGATIGVLVHKEGQLAAERHRDERVGAFVLAVSQHSHAVDNYFALYERRLDHLAGRAREVMAWAEVSDLPIYYNRDFNRKPNAPPDLAEAPHYRRAISVVHPVFVLAAGTRRQAVKGDVQRLRHLAPALREIMLTPVTGDLDTSKFSPTLIRQIVGEDGVPVARAFITLQNGVHMGYPGQGGAPRGYDGRIQPKYQLASRKIGIFWGNPFLDRYGLGMMLAASTAMYDGDGQFLGVAGLEMTFDWLERNLLALPDAPYVDASFLVDATGDVVIQTARGVSPERPVDGDAGSTDAGQPPAADHGQVRDEDRPVALAPLPYPEVRRELATRRAGRVTFEHQGRTKVAAFYPIEAVGWFYVAVADQDGLLATPADNAQQPQSK